MFRKEIDPEDLTAKELNFLRIADNINYKNNENTRKASFITFFETVGNLIVLNNCKESVYYHKIPKKFISDLIDLFIGLFSTKETDELKELKEVKWLKL